MEDGVITLYIKTHRITGLKYFGYTTRKDVSRYKGSGIYWRQHIRKHGNDANTEIVGIFENIDKASLFAIKYSEDNNIVESDEWANLMIENCLGTIVHTDEIKRKISEKAKGRIVSEETRKRMSEAGKIRIFSEEHRNNLSKSGKGRVFSKEHLEKMSQVRKGTKLPKEWCENVSKAMKGKKRGSMSEDQKQKLSKFFEETWIVIDPEGNKQVITNLKKFCKDNGLCRSGMWAVSCGRYTQHKGWKCQKMEATI